MGPPYAGLPAVAAPEEIDMLQEEIQGELGDEFEEMAELLETENLHLKPVQVEELKKIVEIAEIPCDELSDILINQSDGLLPCIKKADGDRVALLEISGTTRKCTKKQKRAKKARKAKKAKKKIQAGCQGRCAQEVEEDEEIQKVEEGEI